jgi:hypothetical protein
LAREPPDALKNGTQDVGMDGSETARLGSFGACLLHVLNKFAEELIDSRPFRKDLFFKNKKNTSQSAMNKGATRNFHKLLLVQAPSNKDLTTQDQVSRMDRMDWIGLVMRTEVLYYY